MLIRRPPLSSGIALLAIIIIVIPFVVQHQQGLPIFDFRFNSFALLSALGLVADIVILTLLVRRQAKTFDSLWLIASFSAVIIFAIGEVFQRLSVFPEAALFWAQLGGIGAAFTTACYFLFAVNYTQPGRPNAFMTSCVLMGAAVIAFFHANGNIIFRTDSEAIKLFAWGYNNDVGQGFIANLLWFSMLYLLAVILIIRFRRRTANKVLRSQATIFIAASAVPVSGGIIFDSLLPLLGITFLPPVGLLLAVVSGILMVIGVSKYRVFELSPAILSQNILTTMNEAVVVTNETLNIEFFNTEAENLLGGSSATLHSRQITELFTSSQKIEALCGRLIAGIDIDTVEPIEDMAVNGGKVNRFLRILVSPVGRNQHVEGFIFVISDVTELQQAYIELAAAKAGVERIVEERTRELREAQDKLLETDKMKTEFIMLASHNLRTPLATIQGYLDLLALSDLDGTQRHALDSLHASSKRLGSLVDDLLTISSIEAGDQPMDRKPIRITDLLNRIDQDAQEMASTTSSTFTTSFNTAEAHIVASSDRLEAAIVNILDNAFKFTKNGHILFSAQLNEDSLLIVIKDDGVGIKPEEMPKLFTKFHRGSDTLQYDFDGRGLGLYLAKLIVTEHDGTIEVESNHGKGTIVTITIPLTAAVPAAAPRLADRA